MNFINTEKTKSPAYTNLLAKEKSLYLLGHSHNPVDWFPWCDEAFAQAKSMDKPVLLSIGYSSCHWCHVMEKESFEDLATAEMLNKEFISIKVDREERPDVDQIYMKALQEIGQTGGWPLNMFLTPDRLPITGGTYFPPKPLHGRPSFIQILSSISQAWREPEERKKLFQAATKIHELLLQREEITKSTETLPLPSETELRKTAKELQNCYDPYKGGFLFNGPNKFPPSMQILFLLSLYQNHPDKDSNDNPFLEMASNTLDSMKRGGIYDQLGGGLSRYSTDHNWTVPHFEKMLYDNALFAWALVECFRITKKECFRDWCLDIFSYIQNEMTSPEGAFYSAQDADSDGKEGSYYVWSIDEIEAILEKGDFSVDERKDIRQFWSIRAQGHFEGGLNILHEPLARNQFLKSSGYSEKEWESLLVRAKSSLMAERKKRKPPLCDDKILCSWNALMISALSQASRAFGIPELHQRAARALDFLWKNLYQEEGKGHLLRRYREGESRFEGGLSDYAALGCAFLDLYRADFNPSHMQKASILAEEIQKRFSHDSGVFYESPQEAFDTKELIMRSVDSYDGVLPSGNSLSARLFYTLSLYGINMQENYQRARKIFQYFTKRMNSNGISHCFLLYVYSFFMKEQQQIAIVTSKDRTEDPILDWVQKELSGESAIAFTSQEKLSIASGHIPLLYGKDMDIPKQGTEENLSTAAYICKNLVCAKPVYSLEDLCSLVQK